MSIPVWICQVSLFKHSPNFEKMPFNWILVVFNLSLAMYMIWEVTSMNSKHFWFFHSVRFDLIFLMLDPQNEVYDRRLARHLVSLYFQSRHEEEEQLMVCEFVVWEWWWLAFLLCIPEAPGLIFLYIRSYQWLKWL